MKLDIAEDGGLRITELFTGVKLETADGVVMYICMRDSGFEFRLADEDNPKGVQFRAADGVIAPLGPMVEPHHEDDENSLRYSDA